MNHIRIIPDSTYQGEGISKGVADALGIPLGKVKRTAIQGRGPHPFF
jgi:hypothetical protein